MPRTKASRSRRLHAIRATVREHPEEKLARAKAERREVRHAERKPDPYAGPPPDQATIEIANKFRHAHDIMHREM